MINLCARLCVPRQEWGTVVSIGLAIAVAATAAHIIVATTVATTRPVLMVATAEWHIVVACTVTAHIKVTNSSKERVLALAMSLLGMVMRVQEIQVQTSGIPSRIGCCSCCFLRLQHLLQQKDYHVK